MKRVAIPALAALALFSSGPAIAQETVTIDGVEAQRVVIAPPQNDLAAAIKQGLSGDYAATRPETSAYADAQKLYFFYGARHFEPVWLTTAENGDIAFSDRARAVLKVFDNAHLEGLRPADYLTDAIDLEGIDLSDPARVAALETDFSAAAVRYAQDAHGGRVDPRQVSSTIDLNQRRIDSSQVLLDLVAAETPGEFLLSMSPQHAEFQALRRALARKHAGETQEVTKIPEGEVIRPGMSDGRLPLVRDRLQVASIGNPNTYDEALVDAVRSYQQQKGLLVDGVIGPATIGALNGANAASRADIVANMERWRWMPENMGDFHVMVNIPEFRLYIERNGEAVHSTNVIVGQREHKTPIFSDEIEHVVVNPYWNVPSSIARNEIAPQLQGNPGYLASRNMELLYDGQQVNPYSVDWSRISMNTFRIRQRPGASNALGNVKFLFPNRHAVYLHDTPSRSLFARGYRTFSHGCVRVEDPMAFAQALLANEPNLSRASLEAQYGPKERWNNLETHVPVHLTYFTVRADDEGNLQSFPDPYGHHETLKRLLDA